MPVKSRKAKGRQHRITPDVIAAWLAADYMALHRALGLHPWEASPLPYTITSLGVSEELVASADPKNPHEQTYAQALELQRELLAVAGWPAEAREAYQQNLREAQERTRYCVEMVAHPERGGQGTGCDPASRQAALEAALDGVAYYQELLDDLGPA